jgi:hypothetical protein
MTTLYTYLPRGSKPIVKGRVILGRDHQDGRVQLEIGGTVPVGFSTLDMVTQIEVAFFGPPAAHVLADGLRAIADKIDAKLPRDGQ